MITGELKNKIDSLWDIFAAGGLVNPLDVIEQITYLKPEDVICEIKVQSLIQFSDSLDA